MKIRTLKKIIDITIITAPVVTTIMSCIGIYKKGKELENELENQYEHINTHLKHINKLLAENNFSEEQLKIMDNSIKNLPESKKINLDEIKE